MSKKQRQFGIYDTALFNPFSYKAFTDWIHKHKLKNETVLEPFAGSNSIIKMLQSVGFADRYQSYDKYPRSRSVQKKDTLAFYPKGFKLCITNPPWLYKPSAVKRGLNFPKTDYDDLYKLSLSLSLKNNEYIGFLIPASFIQSGLFHERLERVIFLNRPLFSDTETPVCLALFGSEAKDKITVYDDEEYIGSYEELKAYLPPAGPGGELKFNEQDGALGLIAIDNHKAPSIRFCEGRELEDYPIKNSSRAITRITGASADKKLLKKLNHYITEFRHGTRDIFLTPFKGLRKDNKYRRRMDYALARNIINHVR